MSSERASTADLTVTLAMFFFPFILFCYPLCHLTFKTKRSTGNSVACAVGLCFGQDYNYLSVSGFKQMYIFVLEASHNLSYYCFAVMCKSNLFSPRLAWHTQSDAVLHFFYLLCNHLKLHPEWTEWKKMDRVAFKNCAVALLFTSWHVTMAHTTPILSWSTRFQSPLHCFGSGWAKKTKTQPWQKWRLVSTQTQTADAWVKALLHYKWHCVMLSSCRVLNPGSSKQTLQFRLWAEKTFLHLAGSTHAIANRISAILSYRKRLAGGVSGPNSPLHGLFIIWEAKKKKKSHYFSLSEAI